MRARLSYRHGFHAGNWADVHKYIALALLLGHLRRKDKAFCVLDGFAGDGVYDLTSAEAAKRAAFRDGIGRALPAADAPADAPVDAPADAPAGADWYPARVRAMNPAGRLAVYPGSPAPARAALRESDRLIVCEQHPTAHARLRRWRRRYASGCGASKRSGIRSRRPAATGTCSPPWPKRRPGRGRHRVDWLRRPPGAG